MALACLIAGAEAARKKPNLIVIVADDLGYGDVGYNGCTDFPTPHIDALAESGVQFSSGYAAYSVCGPSRAEWSKGLIEPAYLGLEHTKKFKENNK